MKKLDILFLCTGNSCRSQMAEGWTRYLKPKKINAYSAGIETHGLNRNAVKVMMEAGVDISGQQSKHVEALKGTSFDYVITVCDNANESCPIFTAKTKVLHIGFEDPPMLAKALAEKGASEEEQLNCYRKVRDEIRGFVETLPESLGRKDIKRFFSKLIKKLASRLKARAKSNQCCGSGNKGDSSCC